MRRIYLLLLLFVTVSCVQKVTLRPGQEDLGRLVGNDPYVAPQGSALFRAEVESLSGTWKWDAVNSRVGVYSSSSDNQILLPRSRYDGATGEVELFGANVLGQAYAYLPYQKKGEEAVREGRLPLRETQRHYAGNVPQIEGNILMVAPARDGKFTFRYLCGTLHIRIKLAFTENVKSVSISANEPLCGWMDITGESGFPMINASYSVTVTDIDKPCTLNEPLDVWVALPEGSYTGLLVTVSCLTQSQSTVISGTWAVTAGLETVVEAKEENYDYSGTDFISEEVQYD